MNIRDLIESGANVSVTVNLLDLKEFMLSLLNERDEEKGEVSLLPKPILRRMRYQQGCKWINLLCGDGIKAAISPNAV